MSFSKAEVEKKIVEMLSQKTGKAASSLSMTDSLTSDVGLDSLDLIEMASSIEEIFSVEISDFKVMADLKTVGDVCAFVATKVGATA